MSNDMLKHDVIIIGAGPSGLSTALHLVKIAPYLTPRILILEKARHPRPKLCAGGLVADAEIILQHLGLDVSEVPHVDVEAAHFDFAGKGLNIRVPNRYTLRVIRRDEFDAWLAKQAEGGGVEIKEGIAVRNIIPDHDRVTVITDQGQFHAQVVVGADGSNGVTRRCVLPDAPIHTARTLEVLTPTQPSSKFRESGRGRERAAYFDFFPVPENIAGYVWDFPTQVQGEAMRCWGIYDTNILADGDRPPLKKPLAEEMAQHGFDLNQYELKGHPIRWFDPFTQISVPRVLLVGDAAGADPIFGEGISIALGYGAVAAREIGEAFQREDFSFSRYKQRVVRSALGQTLIARWLITQVLYHMRWTWFQKFFWRVFKPVVVVVSWILVLNWGKRLRT